MSSGIVVAMEMIARGGRAVQGFALGGVGTGGSALGDAGANSSVNTPLLVVGVLGLVASVAVASVVLSHDSFQRRAKKQYRRELSRRAGFYVLPTHGA